MNKWPDEYIAELNKQAQTHGASVSAIQAADKARVDSMVARGINRDKFDAMNLRAKNQEYFASKGITEDEYSKMTSSQKKRYHPWTGNQSGINSISRLRLLLPE